MIELLSGFPDNVLAARGRGRLTAQDYMTVLEPAAAEKLRRHKPLRFFYHLGADYDGISLGGMVEDARTGLAHWKDWGAIAIVTESASVREMAGFFGLFFHHPVRLFYEADYDQAKAWISAPVVSRQDAA